MFKLPYLDSAQRLRLCVSGYGTRYNIYTPLTRGVIDDIYYFTVSGKIYYDYRIL